MLAAPYRFEFAPNAAGINGDGKAGECGSMLLVVRHHVILQFDDQDPDEWDDGEEKYGSVSPPPRGLQYHYVPDKNNRKGFGWWLGKKPAPRFLSMKKPRKKARKKK